MDQQTFLRVAKRELGLSYPQLAAELGVSPRTMEKWSLGDRAVDHRAMPFMAVKFISRLLEERKRDRVLAGDRETAETVDALISHVSGEKFRDALHTFNALQRSANTFVPMTVPPDKPRYFESLADKNAWGEEEELRHARRAKQKGARTR